MDINGHLNFTIFDENELKRLRNHIAEIKTINSKLHMDLVNEFKTLIEFTFKYLGFQSATIDENDYIEVG